MAQVTSGQSSVQHELGCFSCLRDTRENYNPHHRLCILDIIYNNNHIQRRNSRFFTISSLCHEPSPTRTHKWLGCNRVQIMCNTFSAYHVQHVVIRVWQSWNRIFYLSFIGWTINRWRRGGNQSTWRKPLATSFRKCHILQPEDSSPKWDSNSHNSIGGRLGKQMCCYTTHRPKIFVWIEANLWLKLLYLDLLWHSVGHTWH